jgi:hypothetical protein
MTRAKDSQKTRLPLPDMRLRPNHVLRALIMTKNDELMPSDEADAKREPKGEEGELPPVKRMKLMPSDEAEECLRI